MWIYLYIQNVAPKKYTQILLTAKGAFQNFQNIAISQNILLHCTGRHSVIHE